MDSVEEIEAAIENLSDGEFRRIARWLRERDQALWDRELDSDSSSGKLDFLFEEAERDAREGTFREWPTSE